MTVVSLICTIAVASAFGLLLSKAKIPGGLLIGSLVGAAAVNISTETAWMPPQTTTLVQIVAGAFIGCSMERSDLRRLPSIVKPAAIMLVALLILNMGCGFLIYEVSDLDLATSLMSTVPGGISDTPIIALDMGADGPKVAVMQLVRQVLGIAILPTLVYWSSRRFGFFEENNPHANADKRVKTARKEWTALLATLAVASVAGLFGRWLGIPAGTFFFALVASLFWKLSTGYAFLPKKLKKIAQVLSGCYLGSTITVAGVIGMHELFLPILIVVAGYTINCFVTGMIISKACHFTKKEGMLITTPAGASDMALIASEIGVQNTDVIILQVVRAVVVMSLFPQLVSYVLSLSIG